MSGYPDFNFPAFERATAQLRAQGYDIISPHELDGEGPSQESWGTVLGRDVTVVADKVSGVAFLPNWYASRGAKLEAFTALLCGHKFYEYREGSLWELKPQAVKQKLVENL